MSETAISTSPGVVNFSRQAGLLNLFCFPYAGGGASAFRLWQHMLPSWVTVCAVQPPGREGRIREAPIADVHMLVDALLPSILAYAQRPFVFVGHSVGALVAFEMARRLRREGKALPELLCVAAARAPHIPEPRPLHHLPEKALLQGLRRFFGTPEEILQNKALMELYLPILRADLAVEERYVYVSEQPLNIDIAAFYGNADAEVSHDEVEAWSAHTYRSFSVRVIPGGHFFVKTAKERFLSELMVLLRTVIKNYEVYDGEI